MQAQYHITRDDPCEPHWPNGSWSVYRISGDQIADRIVRNEVVKPTDGTPYYQGAVIGRHSWCGYLGMTETFDGVRDMIEKDQAEQEAQAKPRKVA
jgi:hypothetical protein